MGNGFEDAKEIIMKCTVCGARMCSITTDLPFKLSEERIVILKQLPVLQWASMPRVSHRRCRHGTDRHLLARGDSTAELEVIRYAA
jgi:hypothetical protein